MISKELDEALDQYAEAALKHAKLCKEINKERGTAWTRASMERT